MDQELKRELSSIQKKLNDLMAGKRKETWAGPGWVTKLTGWNNETLRQARDQQIVEFKRSPTGGWLYKLESIPEQFIKKTA